MRTDQEVEQTMKGVGHIVNTLTNIITNIKFLPSSTNKHKTLRVISGKVFKTSHT